MTDTNQISDGYHTFGELYEHRHSLCLALMKALPEHSWFSLKHSDGELCFGDGEWFVAGITLPGMSIPSDITYHLPIRLWTVAQRTGAKELEQAPKWDGHTSLGVISRLLVWSAMP